MGLSVKEQIEIAMKKNPRAFAPEPAMLAPGPFLGVDEDRHHAFQRGEKSIVNLKLPDRIIA